ncbi:Septin and tuftelin-interacting protein 1-like protein [Aphelenchoides fujianensis]|nr:Septin and tuftelin-interacting protein 1-like protein [Aphelenchoides fujianensis]
MDDGFESFEVDERDLEFALGRGSRGRRQTKNEAIYGIWADEEDEADGRRGFGRGARSSGPVAFVSGGVSRGNKMDEEEDAAGPSTSGGPREEDEPVEVAAFPEAKRPKFGGNAAAAGRPAAFAGMRTAGGTEGAWISPKIAAMMKASGRPPPLIPPPERAEDAQRNAWKKTHARRVKPKFVTLDEVVAERADVPAVVAKQPAVKFIDMTGPDQRVYDSIHSFHQRAERPVRRPNFDVPALADNVDQLLLDCKEEIRQNGDHLLELRTKTGGLERDRAEMAAYVEDTRREVEALKAVAAIVEQFDRPAGRTAEEKLAACRRLFARLRADHAAEFAAFGLEALVELRVTPLLADFFRAWRPLEQPRFGLEEVRAWRALLEGGGTAGEPSAFDAALWSAWMPPVRRAALEWRPRTECAAMIGLVAAWFGVLPGWILDVLFEQLLIPRLRSVVVDEWEPRTDPLPIDAWIVPWHEVLGDRLLVVYPLIRQKLARALREWTATDETALAVLRPWRAVWSAGTMQGFLAANIVPKLEEALRRMPLDEPNTNPYKEFHALLAWAELLSADIVAALLTRNFFPRWYAQLCQWVQVPGALPDVREYYREWRERLPAELAARPDVRAEFVRALRAIQQAQAGHAVTPLPNFADARPTAPPPPRSAAPPAAPFVPTSLRHAVEARAQELGVLFAPQPQRFHNGRPVYSFGPRSIVFDRDLLFVHDLERAAWIPTAFPQLIASLQE